MLNIALPKGRLGDKVYGLFSSIGYDCTAIYEDNRKLVFENPERGVRYLLVKPSDVAIYMSCAGIPRATISSLVTSSPSTT